MGFFDPLTDGMSIGPGGMSRPKRRKHRSRSRSRSSSRGRRRGESSIAGALFGDGYSKHNASRGSLFGLGNASRSSFFNFGSSGNRSSYYKRSPRQGFMQRAYRRLRRLIRDLVHYAKRHPWKVFFLVVMPLFTTGVLGGLLARFGLRIPPSLERMLGVASKAASGDSFGFMNDAVRMAGSFGGAARGRDGGMHWERTASYNGPRGGDGWGNVLTDAAKRFF